MPFVSVENELHKFKHGQLHSGRGGKVVKLRKQAVAIALSEQRRAGESSSMHALKKVTR